MANYIIGVVIGLVVALIVVLILKNTVFKDKNMTILYVVIFVLMAVLFLHCIAVKVVSRSFMKDI